MPASLTNLRVSARSTTNFRDKSVLVFMFLGFTTSLTLYPVVCPCTLGKKGNYPVPYIPILAVEICIYIYIYIHVYILCIYMFPVIHVTCVCMSVISDSDVGIIYNALIYSIDVCDIICIYNML